jgi:tetratricopeptide (TPR) repeat protein
VQLRRFIVRALLLACICTPTPARAGLVERAEQLFRTIPQQRDREHRFAVADQVQSLCEQAIREHPRDPAPHIVLARVLTTADPDHPEVCRPHSCERAIAELKEARRLDAAGAEGQHIASELGLVFSRVGAYEDALDEYDRALKLVDPERHPNMFDGYTRGVLYGNSAETLMALGRLDQAIERYRQAEANSMQGEIEWELAEWGLGVALDRDEQIEKSRQAIQRALEIDPTMAHLADESVFFEPAGDKRYYEALGHEVAGDRELALAAWRAFLAEAPSSQYARRARAHLADLKRSPAGSSMTDPARVRVSVGEIMDLRGLRSAASLRDVVAQHHDELRLCYARVLRTEPQARGELRLQLVIEPNGWLYTRARVLLSTVESDKLGHCVELAATTWRFPVSDVPEQEEIVVTLSFAGR